MEKNKDYNSVDAAHGFFWGICAPRVFAVVLVILFSVIAAAVDMALDKFIELPVIKEVSLLSSQIAFIIYIIIYNKKMNIDFFNAIKINRKFNVLIALLCVVMGAMLVYLCAPFVNLINFGLESIGYNPSGELPISLNSPGMLVLGLFMLAIVPAIVEEVMFRGIVTNGLLNDAKTKKKKVLMVVFSGLIFALIHTSLQQTIYPFVVGCILAVILLLTDNLIYTMIVHFTSNVIVVINSYVTGGVTEELSYTVGEGFAAFGLFVLALALATGLIFLIAYIVKKNKKSEDGEVEIISPDEIKDKNTKKEKKDEKLLTQKQLFINELKNNILKNKLFFNLLSIAIAVVFIISDLFTYIK